MDRLGNPPGPIAPHVSEQQLVVRSTSPSGEIHYVLLNGEHEDAVDRGEGHEQPDQLQLLYYRDDLSYLLDSGYDQGATVENSSWNHYYDHNVLTAGDGEGGLWPPVLNLLEVRKSSEPWFMGQASELYLEEHGAVTVLHAKQRLSVEPWFFYHADYTRDLLFVSGAEPYLIDLNRAAHVIRPFTCEPRRFSMSYHANSDRAVVPPGYSPREHGFLHWEAIGGREGSTLHAFPMSAEFDLAASHVQIVPDSVMEREGLSVNEEGPGGKQRADIDKLVLHNPSWCEPYWTVSTLFQITDDGTPTGAQPELVWSGNEATEKQGWIWPHGNGIVDVFVARSVRAPAALVQFSPAEVDPSFPDLRLLLPEGAPYGFARLEGHDRGWHIHPEYQIRLEEAVAAGPSVALGGNHTEQLADAYALSGVHPNPFNPTAQFTLRVRESQAVTITAYDVLGRRMAILHEGELAAGQVHQFEIDGSRWASGLYLLRVEAEQFVDVHRVMLMK